MDAEKTIGFKISDKNCSCAALGLEVRFSVEVRNLVTISTNLESWLIRECLNEVGMDFRKNKLNSCIRCNFLSLLKNMGDEAWLAVEGGEVEWDTDDEDEVNEFWLIPEEEDSGVEAVELY